MKLNKDKNGLSREQAAKIYEDLRSGFEAKMTSAGKPGVTPQQVQREISRKAPPSAANLSAADLMQVIQRATASDSSSGSGKFGKAFAIILVLVFGGMKIALAALEHAGIGTVSTAQATVATGMSRSMTPIAVGGEQSSREEIKILTALDARRQDLDQRSKRLDEREFDQEKRDREFAAKLTELRELTDKLKVDREKDDKKRDAQLAQLANVYGSMNPQEAAQLMEQLDVTIALALIERMPEKRIGQILALMNPERALAITRMLSGKIGR